MKIHSLSFKCYDSIIELWKNAGLPYRPKGRDSPDEIKGQFEKDSDLILGAFENDKLIGVIFGSDDGRRGWINRLAVTPEFQGKGIGKKLISTLEGAFQDRGRKINYSRSMKKSEDRD
jgi:ribosomal protein S18 acetylase RimI-like enzyme